MTCWTLRQGASFKNSFSVPAPELFKASNAERGKITGCAACPPNTGWQMASKFCLQQSSNMRNVSVRKCGWSPSAIAQLAMSDCQPLHLAAHTMELNMPRSGRGFSIRSDFGKFKRSSSAASAESSGRSTTAICAAPNSCHCEIRWPMIVMSRHGSSSFGRPIRDDAPAPRMTTANLFMGDFGRARRSARAVRCLPSPAQAERRALPSLTCRRISCHSSLVTHRRPPLN